MVSAAHPLETWHSYRLFRFSTCCYVTKGVIIIGRPPLRYVHPDVKFDVSSSVSQCRRSKLDTQIALLLVVKINISAYILSQLQDNRRDSV